MNGPWFRTGQCGRSSDVCVDATCVIGWIGHTESAGVSSLAVAACAIVRSVNNNPIVLVESAEDLGRTSTRFPVPPLAQFTVDRPKMTAPLRAGWLRLLPADNPIAPRDDGPTGAMKKLS